MLHDAHQDYWEPWQRSLCVGIKRKWRFCLRWRPSWRIKLCDVRFLPNKPKSTFWVSFWRKRALAKWQNPGSWRSQFNFREVYSVEIYFPLRDSRRFCMTWHRGLKLGPPRLGWDCYEWWVLALEELKWSAKYYALKIWEWFNQCIGWHYFTAPQEAPPPAANLAHTDVDDKDVTTLRRKQVECNPNYGFLNKHTNDERPSGTTSRLMIRVANKIPGHIYKGGANSLTDCTHAPCSPCYE